MSTQSVLHKYLYKGPKKSLETDKKISNGDKNQFIYKKGSYYAHGCNVPVSNMKLIYIIFKIKIEMSVQVNYLLQNGGKSCDLLIYLNRPMTQLSS